MALSWLPFILCHLWSGFTPFILLIAFIPSSLIFSHASVIVRSWPSSVSKVVVVVVESTTLSSSVPVVEGNSVSTTSSPSSTSSSSTVSHISLVVVLLIGGSVLESFSCLISNFSSLDKSSLVVSIGSCPSFIPLVEHLSLVWLHESTRSRSVLVFEVLRGSLSEIASSLIALLIELLLLSEPIVQLTALHSLWRSVASSHSL